LASLASASREKGHHANAIRLYRRCIELAPSNASYYVRLANLYNAIDMPGEAETVLWQGVINAQSLLMITRTLADTLFRQGKYHSALKLYYEAIELSKPRQPAVAVYHGIAKSNLEIGDYTQSEKYFRIAMSRSDNPWVYYDYSDLKVRTGDYLSAIEALDIALGGSFFPDRSLRDIVVRRKAGVMFDYAEILYKRKNKSEARIMLSKIVENAELADTYAGKKATFFIDRW
jgi:tetratricopeptide (TPR) repeat protein